MGRLVLSLGIALSLLGGCSEQADSNGADASGTTADVGSSAGQDIGDALPPGRDGGQLGPADVGDELASDVGPTVVELAGCAEGYQRPDSLENDCRSTWVEDVGGVPVAGCDGTTLKLAFATTMGTEAMYVCGCTTYCPKLCPPQGDMLFQLSVFSSADIPAACDDGSSPPDAGGGSCTPTGNACLETSECCEGRCKIWGGSLQPLLGTCGS